MSRKMYIWQACSCSATIASLPPWNLCTSVSICKTSDAMKVVWGRMSVHYRSMHHHIATLGMESRWRAQGGPTDKSDHELVVSLCCVSIHLASDEAGMINCNQKGKPAALARLVRQG